MWAKPWLDNDGSTQHPFAKYHFRVDCSAWTVKVLLVTTYTARGPDDPAPLSAGPQGIARGSGAEAAANFVCRGRLDPAIAAGHLISQDEAVREARSGFAAGGRPRDTRGK